MSQTSVLVTGAAGYIGSVLCGQLLEAGYRVVALDNLTFGTQSLFHLADHPSFEFTLGDARDERVVKELVSTCDVAIPLAALVGAPICERDPGTAVATNLEAIRLLNRLRSPSQLLIYPTTNSGYGTKSGDVFCTEDTPLEPISLYGRTKVDAEADVLSGPNSLSLRLATVFGTSPRMRIDLLVNHFVWAAVTDGYLVVFEKEFRRNYLHVRDAADAFVFAIRNSGRLVGRPYNLGLDAANLSKEQLALKVKEHLPAFHVHFAEVGHDPDRRDYVVSSDRLRQAGFEATRGLDQGIRELIKSYRMMGRGAWKNV
jgi:nucleoside-diphosphate-sugar epimerase